MLMMIARTHAIFQSTVAHETPFCAPRLCADWMLEPGHSSVGLSIKGSGLGVRSTGSRFSAEPWFWGPGSDPKSEEDKPALLSRTGLKKGIGMSNPVPKGAQTITKTFALRREKARHEAKLGNPLKAQKPSIQRFRR